MHEDGLAKTILILDTDLGFVFWLGEILTQAGYRAVPAQSIKEATSLMRRLKTLADLLIVSPAVHGAAEWMQSRGNPLLRPVIAAVEDPVDGRVALMGARAVCRKPEFGRPDADAVSEAGADRALRRVELEWLATVQQVLEEGAPGSPHAFPWASPN